MKKIVIYTKEPCPYCLMAKNLLDNKKLPYEEIRIDLNEEKFAEMLQRSQRRTVPQIFIDQQPIGGFDDLAELAKSGKLDELINSK